MEELRYSPIINLDTNTKMKVSLAAVPQEKTPPVPTRRRAVWDPDMVLKRKIPAETEYQTAKEVEHFFVLLA